MDTLFSSFKLAGLTLKNRIVFAPVTTGFATGEGLVTQLMIDHYRKRAQGGAALLIVEPGVVYPKAKLFPTSMCLYGEEHVKPLSRLADAVHRAGGLTFIQLCHAGPRARSRDNGCQPLAPCGYPFFKHDLPREMTRGEIDGVVEMFALAARRAARAGMDGVEIHGAHFYLLSSFLSGITNRRADEYGGTMENRARLVVQIIQAIKEEVDESFPVTVRFNAREWGEGGMDSEQALALAGIFAGAGADGLHVSSYDLSRPELEDHVTVPASSIPGELEPAGVFLPYAGEIKKAVKIPVIGVGKINDPQLAAAAVENGSCDLVAMGRALLADPELPLKAWARSYTVCIYCGNCSASLAEGRLKCAVNPGVGAE